MAVLAATAAGMAWDSGQGAIAQRYYLLAVRAANEAGDLALAANVLASMARQHFCLGHITEGLELVRLAQDAVERRARPTPALRAMLHTREAWAYAKQGRLAAFRRATSRAEDHARDIDETSEPYWIAYFDEAELAGVTGGRLLEAAHRNPTHASAAAVWISRAIELRTRARSPRSAALDQLGFAEIRLIQGEYDEAAQLGHAALDIAEHVHSGRIRVKLAELYQHATPRASTKPLAELCARIKPILAAV